MANQYTAEKKTIGELLSLTSPTIQVPEWQRDYSWDAGQIEIFWQDLIAFSDQYPDKTIGREEYFLGSIVLVNQQGGQLLLDGQQRLATATIILSVIRDKLAEFKKDAATRTEEKYIKEIDDATGKDYYKLTLNRFDQDFYKAEVQDFDRPHRPKPVRRSHELIANARDYFRAQFDKKYSDLGGGRNGYQWALRIREVVTDHMSVVAVLSADEDNAAAVFETLNDRGIGLSTPDLLRNLLLRRADKRAHDQIIRSWLTIYSLEEGSVRVDEFLRHYWLSEWGDVKTRSLYREMKSVIEKGHVDSLRFSNDLAGAAVLYKDITSGIHTNKNIERRLQDINDLGARSLYPAVLSCLSVSIPDVDKEKLLKMLIIFYVRHIVIGNRESTVLEKTVYKVAREMRKTKNIIFGIKAIITASPKDTEFQTQFVGVTIRRLASARYVLKELERYKRKTMEVVVEAPDRVHVEHIYPQNPSSGSRWPNHEQYIDRLGNLTLLSRTLNEKLKNAKFDLKKSVYKDSDLYLTKELLGYARWNTGSVDKRQKELSACALKIWKLDATGIA